MGKPNLIDQLKRHEGFRSRPYRCPAGKLTIGYGYNLEKGMSTKLAEKILEWEVEEVKDALSKLIPFFEQLSPARQDVFVNMSMNLGIHGLLGFRRMLEAARRGNVESVCAEMKNSAWYRQVGARADELIDQYQKG